MNFRHPIDEGTPSNTPRFYEAFQQALSQRDPALLFARLVLSELAAADSGDRGRVFAMVARHFAGQINMIDFRSAIKQAQTKQRTLRTPSGMPEIPVSGQPLRTTTKLAIDALQSDPGPNLYVRAARLSRLRYDELKQPFIEIVSVPALRNALDNVADFFSENRNGRIQVPPPDKVVENILASEELPFPALEGIIECPVMRPDGTVLNTRGYDHVTRLFYAPLLDSAIPDVPQHPSDRHVVRAKALLDDILCDFPFEDAPSKANAIAFMLSAPARPLIDGCVPLFLNQAREQGTGKGLLIDVCTHISTGRIQPKSTAPTQKAEWCKSITSELLLGRQLIIYDNVEDKIKSADLAAALTTTSWTDRKLGTSNQITVPQRAVWAATGNNILLAGDIARRSYMTMLNADVVNPSRRDGFRHPDLLAYVREHQPQLLAALLTLIRAWIVAGRTVADTPRMGSFESWCRVIGGILANAGITGFLGNRALLESADDTRQEWAAFLEAVFQVTNGKVFFARQVATQLIAATPDSALRISVPSELLRKMDAQSPELAARLIGEALSSRQRARYGKCGWMVQKAGDRLHGTQPWIITHSDAGA